MFVTYFLLLSSLGLVITTQAQDCSKPAGGDNMSLKGEDILLQTFPEGKQVTFACNVGYVAVGGSPSITCTAGAWTPLKLKCERRDCGFAGDVENGNVDYPEGTQFGDKLVVTCNTGYNMVPKKGHLLCGAQGWMDRLPVCEVVTCDPPPVVANGVFSPVKESYDYREVVQYKCQNDYTLNGSSSISCSEHGTFDPAPTCVLVRCEDPNIANGHQVDGSQPPHGYNSTVTYECKSGYVIEGGRTLTCGIDSQWSPGLPTCQRRDCGFAGEVENGNVETRVLVRCEDPKIANARQVDGSRPPHGYNSTVTYECKSGYVMEGGRTLTCGIDGQWLPGLPTCQTQDCSKPAGGDNMSLKGEDILLQTFPDGKQVTFACNVGYVAAGGSPSITCFAGAWTPLKLKCESE